MNFTSPSELRKLGYNYQKGINVNKDEKKAFELYIKAANMGYSIAMNDVGFCYLNGIGVEKDEDKAFFYYQKSADMGNVNGIYNIGFCYQNGIGVEKDEHKAFFYYQKSADMGDVNGICNVGYCYCYGIGVEKDEHKAFFYYQKSADMGNALGANNVGYCYRNGIGVENDEHKAFFYFQKSVDMGHVYGIYNVGSCYLYGNGVSKDERKAFECFLKLASTCDIRGTFQVAQCYRNGIGVDRNIQKANYWYQRYNESVTIKYKFACDQFDIDKNLKMMLIKNKYQLPWIPYEEFNHIISIGKGGFAIVYRADWHDKSRNLDTTVALKKLNSDNRKEFIEELRIFCEIRYVYPSFLKCFGISKDDEGNYVLVLEFARKKSLSNNLYEVSQVDWKKKLKLLQCITFDLDMIHFKGFIHKDLHSGNILQDDIDNAYVSDLGLTTSMENKSGGLYGVLPYVAPEILIQQEQQALLNEGLTEQQALLNEGLTEQQALLNEGLTRKITFTQSADIYSLGIIMTEISTGSRAFDGHNFEDLAIKICMGLRPEFAHGTPDCYIELAKRCMDPDPQKRPTAVDITSKLYKWNRSIENSIDIDEIKMQFLEADKIRPNPVMKIHPDQMYSSKPINMRNSTDSILKLKGSNQIKTMEIPNSY